MRKIVLRGINLVKYEGKQRILDYCHFSVYAREILGIVGVDGSGIATLAGVLEGKIQVDKGSLTMHKKKVELASRASMMRQGIFSISQRSSLIPQMSVMENVCAIKPFAWKDFWISRKKMEETVVKLFDRYNLNIPLKKPVYQLTRLERDMVEICRAALYEAKVLVLYEVSEGYTNQEWDILRKLLIRIKDEGISVVFIHSDINKILKIADRVDVIAKGFIQTEFWPADYTDNMLKVLYQSEQFYSMHKTLELEKNRLGEQRILKLKVEELMLPGMSETVTLEIPEGVTTGIVAADGKAAELAQILGRRKRGKGQFSYKGREYNGRRWKRGNNREVVYVGSMFWQRYFFNNLTIGENIVLRAYPRFHKGLWLDKKMIRFAVKEYCRIYHLDETMIDRTPEKDVLKEIFWISLAVQPPEILVMEEPFYALDEVGRLYLHKYMRLLKEKKCAIIVCGKNQGEIEQFCDKTYCLM